MIYLISGIAKRPVANRQQSTLASVNPMPNLTTLKLAISRRRLEQTHNIFMRTLPHFIFQLLQIYDIIS